MPENSFFSLFGQGLSKFFGSISNSGNLLIFVMSLVSIAATIAYFLSISKGEKFTQIGRRLFYTLTLLFVATSAFLMSNIFSHNFQYNYVWEYSSRQLSTLLLISSFYAGQEGSFLLWALFLALVGYFLIPYAKKRGYESVVMGIYSLLLLFLVVILIFKNPFALKDGQIAANGRGLNPILENYWIIIHPPVLFIGYAAMSVPYIFAVAALLKRDYHNWINIALPWTVIATGILGLGIMMGGFWAYETLGWGGFWGWDPVENSSLLPWLVAVALIHSMLVQKKTKGLIKTNFILAFTSFLLVLYATFLTRSGVLTDASVHSFGDPGKEVYGILLFLQLFFLALGFVVLIIRMKDIAASKMSFGLSSREFTLSIGSIILLASTIVIFIGTSWPIIAKIFNATQATVDISFYNIWNLPLVVLILVLNNVGLIESWKGQSFAELKSKGNVTWIFLLSQIFFGVLGLVLLLVQVLDMYFVHLFRNIKYFQDFEYIVLLIASFCALVYNIIRFGKVIINTPTKTGAYISHLGIALMMIGVVASCGYSKTQPISLKINESANAFGYTFTYLNRTQIEKELSDREKYEFNIKVTKDNQSEIIKPIIYLHDFNGRSSPYFEPGIERFMAHDLYISPKALMMDNGPSAELAKGQSTVVEHDSNYSIQFLSFDMSHMSDEKMNPNDFAIGAVILLHNKKTNKSDTMNIPASMDMQSGELKPVWTLIDSANSKVEIGFTQFLPSKENIAASKIILSFRRVGEAATEAKEIVHFDVSVKPFINAVWFGVIAIVFGFIVAFFKYFSKRKQLLND
ncbi:MAG: cytochrome c biogenesis protein CcsA [Candidatus Kapabacteria bacterium]|nr:cytochrome c biogenesis protein CcsA [Candidatus Kapabacteria bacterium]